jgi:hypothetical protein
MGNGGIKKKPPRGLLFEYPISPPERGRAGNKKSESSSPISTFSTLSYSLFLISYSLFS